MMIPVTKTGLFVMIILRQTDIVMTTIIEHMIWMVKGKNT